MEQGSGLAQVSGGNVSFKSSLLGALKSCTASRDLTAGKQLHSNAIARGQETDIYVANTLINLYAQCGSISDAARLFDAMPRHTLVSWNVLLLGYVTSGEQELVLDLFAAMEREELVPDSFTFVAALRACARMGKSRSSARRLALTRGRALHCRAVDRGLDSNFAVAVNLDGDETDRLLECSDDGICGGSAGGGARALQSDGMRGERSVVLCCAQGLD